MNNEKLKNQRVNLNGHEVTALFAHNLQFMWKKKVYDAAGFKGTWEDFVEWEVSRKF